MLSTELFVTSIQSTVCLSSHENSLPTTEKASSNQLTELQSLAYSGCWCWIIYQQCHSGWILWMTLAYTQFWRFLLKGYCRYFMKYGDRCHHGPIQFNSFNDAVRERTTLWSENLLNKLVYIYHLVSDYSMRLPWQDIPPHHSVLHVWFKYLPTPGGIDWGWYYHS